MTLQQLTYVLALAEHKHFVKAAESCNVSQPTLTLQVKKLEDTLNIQLFDRSTSPLQPTKIGQQIINKAKLIIREVDDLKGIIKQEVDELKGKVKLGVVSTISQYLLPKFIKSFSDKYEDIHLEVFELKTTEIIERLRNNTLDVGVIITPYEVDFVKTKPIFYEPFLVYAHPTSSITRLKKIPNSKFEYDGLWLLEEGHCFRDQMLNLCNNANIKLASNRISFDSGSIETLKNMVRNYGGYTIVNALSIKKDDSYNYSFESPQPVREISLIAHRNYTKNKIFNSLVKHIKWSVPEEFHSLANRRLITI